LTLKFQYEVRDPIYGFIPFTELEKLVIEQPAFQRLRRISQLALTHYVYPGATHTRLSHSLGVMHTASLMYQSVVESSGEDLKREFYFDDSSLSRMHQIVRLAALLHDIGHSPFSHALESVMPKNKKTGEQYKHEDYTIAIINKIIGDIPKNSPHQISKESITDLIDRKGLELKSFALFFKSLISSQLDADRADYLLRDSYHCGVKYGVYDHPRLVNSITLGFDQYNNPFIGIKEESWQLAESLVLARYWMHFYVYLHKTRRIFDYHLEEAVKYIFQDKNLPAPSSLNKYIELDDGSIWEKLKKNKNNVHCNAILNRDHFRLLYSNSKVDSDYENTKFSKIIDKLEEQNIEYFIDSFSSNFYKTETDKKPDNADSYFDPKEIYIVDAERNITPLAEKSTFLSKLTKEISFKNIYVAPKNKKEAKKIIGELK
jgi:HD superfamily phosphohydrolases